MNNNDGKNNKMSDVEKQLLLRFHEQFSENHNHQQSLFVQILAAVIIVFSGYGYVLVNTLDRSSIPLDEKILPITSILVIIVLSFLSFILISQGWGFRFAQGIIQTIREEILKGKYEQYFFNYGNSYKNLPGFYGINLYVLEILKVFTVVVTWNIHNTFCLLIFALIITTATSMLAELVYYTRKKTRLNHTRKGISIKNDCIKVLKCQKCGKVFQEIDMCCNECAKTISNDN